MGGSSLYPPLFGAGANGLVPAPSPADIAAQYLLRADGDWVPAPGGALPSMAGNSGKLLSTDGTGALWSPSILLNTGTSTVGVQWKVVLEDTLWLNNQKGIYLEKADGTNGTAFGNIFLWQTNDLYIDTEGATSIIFRPNGGEIARITQTGIVANIVQVANGLSSGFHILTPGGSAARVLWGFSNGDIYLDTPGGEEFHLRRGGGSDWLATTATSVEIPLTAASTNTTSGALVVGGGLGVAGKINCGGDVETADIGEGFICKSPNGTRWRITVSDAGAFVATSL